MLLTASTAQADSLRISFVGPAGYKVLTIDGQPARYDPEADRLIARLHLSYGLRQVARDAVAVDMAKGIGARRAVEGWVLRRVSSLKSKCLLRNSQRTN